MLVKRPLPGALRAAAWCSIVLAALYFLGSALIFRSRDNLAELGFPGFSTTEIDVLVVGCVVSAGLLGAASCGLFLRWRRARELIVAFWVALQAQRFIERYLATGPLTLNDLWPAFMLTLTCAYLYGAKEMRAFFQPENRG